MDQRELEERDTTEDEDEQKPHQDPPPGNTFDVGDPAYGKLYTLDPAPYVPSQKSTTEV